VYKVEIKKLSEDYNPLMKRKELTFQVVHSSGTPERVEIIKALATFYSIEPNLIYITKMETLTGTRRIVGRADLYDSLERAQQVVPKHIQRKNITQVEAKE
jgi:small subunit ribosomal protein S24e